MKLSRRTFLIASGLAAVAPRRVALGANDDIRVAILGAGVRGGQIIPMLGETSGVRIVAVCDPDRGRAEEKAKLAGPHGGGQPVAIEADLRRVLDRDDVDAVFVTAPNHWHALATVWACQAGKDVFVEKPPAQSVWESRQMVAAAREYGRIVQGGTMRRSYEHLNRLFERVRAGEFGRVTRARAVVGRRRDPIGWRDTPLPIPDGLDYNLWAGPAPQAPLYRGKFHYDWHWMWDTGNGELGNNGSHVLDLVCHGLGLDRLARALMSLGGRLGWGDAGETPNMQVVYYDFRPAPIVLELRNLPAEAGSRQIAEFRGIREGFIPECEDAEVVGMNGAEVRDRAGRVVETIADVGPEVDHVANFIAAVRSRRADDLTCPMPIAHVPSGLCLQGNISHRLGTAVGREEAEAATRSDPALADAWDRMMANLEALRIRVDATAGLVLGPMLAFDPMAERFTGEFADRANRLMRRESYREPFVLREIG